MVILGMVYQPAIAAGHRPEAMLLMAWIKMQLLDRMVAGGLKDVRKWVSIKESIKVH